MLKHFFMDNNYNDFTNFIENIMFNKNNHHLVFDENNKLKRINCLYGVNDEISTITVGKQYEFKNMIPEPYYNYILNKNMDVNYILLDENTYNEICIIGETIDNIYLFSDIDKDNFNDILYDMKYPYLTNPTEVNKYCWNIFENYSKEYFKIIDVNKSIINNKYDEDFYNEEICDKIYDLQKKYKNNIMNEVIKKYKE